MREIFLVRAWDFRSGNLKSKIQNLKWLAARGESRAGEVVCGGEGSTGTIDRVQFFAWRWENEDTKSREGCGWQ
jgi:hypothetical protein